ncbi:Beta-glucan synthesis-associated protein [Phytophthora megakarya]|uniref:Beta-glucan synthesis-associated protein n=1 Tax=Phytophthora megakarya TaxID=4795 RepID=A0A225VJ91_9STRA|nr:Beta-glucan synthesis-associated protein [Phytophthora megakarya]
MAFCKTNDDCNVDSSTSISTGTRSSNGRCKRTSDSWSGSRCTDPASVNSTDDERYGPPLYASLLAAFAMDGNTTLVIFRQ